ncbi:MAG: hypothetical protein P8X89_12825 [Reinekea sp.]
MLPKNRGEPPVGVPAIFEKQIETKFLHPTSTLKLRTRGIVKIVFILEKSNK